MLTLIEKFEQRRLEKKGFPLFNIDITLVQLDKSHVVNNYELYAKTTEDAEILGERIRYRVQQEIDENKSTIAKWGFDHKDMWKHKWGFVAPWKDPMYKRSLISGTRLPALRFKDNTKIIMSAALSKNKGIKQTDLTIEDINKKIQVSIVGYLCFIIIFMAGVICTYSAVVFADSFFSPFTFGAMFAFVTGAIHLAKVIYNHKLLIKWKDSLNE